MLCGKGPVAHLGSQSPEFNSPSGCILEEAQTAHQRGSTSVLLEQSQHVLYEVMSEWWVELLCFIANSADPKGQTMGDGGLIPWPCNMQDEVEQTSPVSQCTNQMKCDRQE